MSIHLIDHLLVLIAFVAVPFYTWKTYPNWARDVAERGEPARIAGYRETVLIWIVLAVAVLSWWGLGGRDWGVLGFGLRWGTGFWVGAVLSAAIIALLAVQLRALDSERFDPMRVVNQARGLEALLPHTARERAWFRAVAINAGITEEIVCRGFLIWYLGSYLGTWGAAVLAVLLFTLAHAYQGLSRAPALLAVSALFVGLYLVTESLWLPILLHAGLDLLQGHLLARSFELAEHRHPLAV